MINTQERRAKKIIQLCILLICTYLRRYFALVDNSAPLDESEESSDVDDLSESKFKSVNYELSLRF